MERKSSVITLDTDTNSSEENLQLLIKSASNYSSFMVDVHCIVLAWSNTAEMMTGYMADEIIGVNSDIIFTVEDRNNNAAQKELEKAAAGTIAINECWIVRKDGSRFWGAVTVSPLRNKEGTIQGFVKIMQDITECTAAEERYKKANVQEVTQLHTGLKETSDRYASVIENMPDSISRWNTLPALVFANKAFERQVGDPIENLYGKLAIDIETPLGNGFPYTTNIRQVFETGENVESYNTIPTMRGLRYFYSSLVAEKNSSGEVETVLVISRDITELHVAQAELSSAKDVLSGVAEAQVVSISVLKAIRDANGNITDLEYIYANKVTSSISGVTELTGKRYNTLFPGASTTTFPVFVSTINTGRTADYEYYYEGEGVKSWFRITAIKFGDAVVVSTEDITARKKAEQEIAMTRDKLSLALESAGGGFGYWNFRTNEASWDNNGKALIGFTTEEESHSMEGWLNRIHEDDRAMVKEITEKCMQDGSDFHMEYRVRHNDGKLLHLNSSGKFWRDENGALLEAFGLIIDISRQRKADQELLGLKEALAQKATDNYLMLFNSIDEGFYLAEVIFDGRNIPVDVYYIDENPAAERIIGESLKGKRLTEISPHYEQYWYEIFGNVIITGESKRMEQYALHNNKWFNFLAVRIGDESSRQIAVVFQDVTDLKNTRLALEQSKGLLQSVFDVTYNGLSVLKSVRNEKGELVDMEYLFANNATKRINKRYDLEGKLYSTVHAGFKSTDYFDVVKKVVETGEPHQYQLHYRFEHLDNWFNITTVRLNDGVVISFEDISQVKKAEMILRESEERKTFLLKLNDVMRSLTDPLAIQEASIQMLRKHLAVNRVAYCAIEGNTFYVGYDHAVDVPSMAIVYQLAEFGLDYKEVFDSNGPFVLEDISAVTRFSYDVRMAYDRAGIGACIISGIVKDGRTVAALAVHSKIPRKWTGVEKELVSAVGERTWLAVQRARTDIALRESEARFRLMADSIPLAVWITDAEGNVEFLNKQWCDYAGIEFQSATASQMAAAFIHPEDAPKVLAVFTTGIREGKAFEIEQRNRSKFAEYRWFMNRGVPYHDPGTGKICKWFGISVDIHDRIIAEEKIRNFSALLEKQVAERTADLNGNRDLLQTVFNAAPVSIAVTKILYNAAGNVDDFEMVVLNEFTLKTTHLSVKEGVGKRFGELFPHSKAMGLFDKLVEVARSGISTVFEYWYEGDGMRHWFYTYAVKLGQMLIITTEDITERKMAEQEILSLKDALTQKATDKYLNLFNSINQGFAVTEMLFDTQDVLADCRWLEMNTQFHLMFGISPGELISGKSVRQLNPEQWEKSFWRKILAKVASTGEATRFEEYAPYTNSWFDLYVFPTGSPGERHVAILCNDITARKQDAANMLFLAEISDEFSRQSSPDDIMQSVGEKIGIYMNVASCHFVDIDESAEKEMIMRYNWTSINGPVMPPAFRIRDYLSEEFERANRAGETVVVYNTQTDTRTNAAGYDALKINAFMTVPFFKANKWKYFLAVTNTFPRTWRMDEVELFEELASRVFTRLEKVRIEDALRKSEQRLRILADAVPQIIWSNEPGGRVLFFNQRWYEYSGLNYKKSVGFGWEAIVHPDDALQSIEKWKEALAAGTIFETEYRLRDASGEYCWFIGRTVPLKDNVGKVTGWFGSATDINKLKQAQEAERITAGRLQLALDAGKLGTYEYDFITGAYISSPQHKINLGYAKGEPDSIETLKEHILPADLPNLEISFRQAVEKGSFYATEYRTLQSDGNIRWIRSVGKLVYDENDELRKMLGITLDITEEKMFTEELSKKVKERTSELQQSNHDLQQFAHVASHDLKEPVRKIKTFSNLITNEYGKILPEDVRLYLDKINGATERMYSMINGVLNYSKLGKAQQMLEQVDLTSVLLTIEQDLELLIQKKNAAISITALPIVRSSEHLMYQLFYNLILNSLKFAKAEEPSRIIVTCSFIKQDQHEFARIVVADNGIGFEQEYAESIFNSFTRLNAADEYEGTGLGLALCKKIVERHTGTISATGQPGKGATFIVLLPLSNVANMTEFVDPGI